MRLGAPGKASICRTYGADCIRIHAALLHGPEPERLDAL